MSLGNKTRVDFNKLTTSRLFNPLWKPRESISGYFSLNCFGCPWHVLSRFIALLQIQRTVYLVSAHLNLAQYMNRSIPEVKFRTTKSSWVKSTEHRQPNTGRIGKSWFRPTHLCVQEPHCTDVLLQKEGAGTMYKGQISVARRSADYIEDMKEAHWILFLKNSLA